jgi:hypothetical protein
MSRLSGEPGTMTSFAMTMRKPCIECSLLVVQTGLEYENGTEATLENGAWLHHIVHYTAGDGHKDAVCPRMPGERTFSVGNEKTITAFGDVLNHKIKSAFPVKQNDKFMMQLELMNLNEVVKQVYITIDYEYIPGPHPKEWKIAKTIWLDATNCGISTIPPPQDGKPFTLSNAKWTSFFDGEMLGVGK